MGIKLSHVLLLAALYFLSQRLYRDRTQNLTFIDTMKRKWQDLGTPSQFYLDPNFIVLFHDILEWRSLNPSNFDTAIRGVNNILLLAEESKMLRYNCVNNYQVAMDHRKLVLNSVYGLRYTLGYQGIYQNKLRSVVHRLMVLLERHVDLIRKNCKRISDTHTDSKTRYIIDAKTVKAYDPMINGLDLF